ncbi:MAG: ergothioneine biosynthesis protein EgtB [Elainellaceae cyanobacterium]
MNFASNHFEGVSHPSSPSNSLSRNRRRLQIKQWFQSCRSATLALFDDVDSASFCYQAHPDFSPVGWHLGHIVYTEALWILERCAGLSQPFPDYGRLFAQDGLPKSERQNLPSFSEIYAYAQVVRDQVFRYLAIAPIDRQEKLWRFLLQHESQHGETIALVLQLQQWRRNRSAGIRDWSLDANLQLTSCFVTSSSDLSPRTPTPPSTMVFVPASPFTLGNDSLDALDNEHPCQTVDVDAVWIDRYPVTCADYRAFIEAGGYQTSEWWSEAGWSWLQQCPVSHPLYWSDSPDWDTHPVCGVSWYEADAYARFVGKRLPTEAEWEKAARWNPQTGLSTTYPWGEALPTSQHCNHDHWIGHTTPVDAYPAGQSAVGCYDLLGNVWEWTSSTFQGYLGFKPYPYAGYSQAYFDGQHKVLRGSSWTTRPWTLRSTFRNWYHPHVRQVLAGFRCARNADLAK